MNAEMASRKKDKSLIFLLIGGGLLAGAMLSLLSKKTATGSSGQGTLCIDTTIDFVFYRIDGGVLKGPLLIGSPDCASISNGQHMVEVVHDPTSCYAPTIIPVTVSGTTNIVLSPSQEQNWIFGVDTLPITIGQGVGFNFDLEIENFYCSFPLTNVDFQIEFTKGVQTVQSSVQTIASLNPGASQILSFNVPAGLPSIGVWNVYILATSGNPPMNPDRDMVYWTFIYAL